MDAARRRALAGQLLEGYVHGPAAATEATVRALAKTESARAVVLVEGVSDQIAVETLAGRRGHDLSAEGVAVLPMGGAHAIRRYLTRFGPAGAGLRLAGLCDAGEEKVFLRGLAGAGIGCPGTRADLEDLGFYVCDEDLEDELIRAIGTGRVEELVDSQGDLGSFRSLQRQPDWRDPAVFHARERDGTLHREKRRLADVEVTLDDAVDVGTSGRQHDAGRKALGAFPLAGDDDTVGEHLRLQPVFPLCGGRIRQRRVDLDHPDVIEQPCAGKGGVRRLGQQIRAQ